MEREEQLIRARYASPVAPAVPGLRDLPCASGPGPRRLSHVCCPSPHEWLSLVDISGPFLSLPVLMRVFPQQLDALDPNLARDTRLAFWRVGRRRRRPSHSPRHGCSTF
jgi:hypothetical protein